MLKKMVFSTEEVFGFICQKIVLVLLRSFFALNLGLIFFFFFKSLVEADV